MIEKLSPARAPRMVFRITQVNTLSTQLEFPELLAERKLDSRDGPPGQADVVEFEFEEDL